MKKSRLMKVIGLLLGIGLVFGMTAISEAKRPNPAEENIVILPETPGAGDYGCPEVTDISPNYCPVKEATGFTTTIATHGYTDIQLVGWTAQDGKITAATKDSATIEFSKFGPKKVTVQLSGEDKDGDGKRDIAAPYAETITVISVKFAPGELDICTDGKSDTSLAGETKQVTATVKPDGVSVQFAIDKPAQATVTPSSGSGTVVLTVTAKGDTDTELKATKDSQVLASMPVRLHKPKGIRLYKVSNPRLPDGSMPDGNKYGDYEVRYYKVYDFRNRRIDISGCFISEDNTMVENDDGKGGKYPEITAHREGASAYSDLRDIVKFTWESGTLEPGHKYKWNQKFQIMGLDVTNNLWKHNARRIRPQRLEIYSFKGQW